MLTCIHLYFKTYDIAIENLFYGHKTVKLEINISATRNLTEIFCIQHKTMDITFKRVWSKLLWMNNTKKMK